MQIDADRTRSESGHLIVGLAILIAVLLIMLTAAAQSWTFIIKRDREAELIFRGEQYARAIEFYRKENNQWPLKLDQLLDQGPHRHGFIRRLWPDPISEDGEWGLLYLSPTGKGFLNPYATTGAQIPGMPGGDPFGSPLGQPSVGPLGQPTRGASTPFGNRSSPGGKTKQGYTEISRDELEKRGISGMNLPIVGVVHKKLEDSVKIYKGFSSMNDWAFTTMDEGQEQNKAAKMYKPGTVSERPPAVGDAINPILRGAPEDDSCSGNVWEVKDCLARKAAEKLGDVIPPHCNSTDPNYDPNAMDCQPQCRPTNPHYDPNLPICIPWCRSDDPNYDPNAPECNPGRDRDGYDEEEADDDPATGSYDPNEDPNEDPNQP